MGEFSTFLFATPSFCEGAARTIDLGNTLTEYNRSLSPNQADRLALQADWLALRADMIRSMWANDVKAIGED
jgi:hypothetical protein